MPRFISIPLVLSFSLACAQASAQTLYDRGPPQHRLIHRSLLALRINPLGLVVDGRLGYRLRLFEHAGVALRDNFLGGGLALTASPAFVRVGPYVEVAPASFATFWASFQMSAHFGSFDLLQSFASARADFSDDELKRRGEVPDGDPEKNYSSLGSEFAVGVDLQAKMGSAVVRARTRLFRTQVNLRAGDTVYYDQLFDLLVPDAGWSFSSDVDALYSGLGNRLFGGLRYTATVPFYRERHFVPGEPEEHDNSTQRLGPLLAYAFRVRDGAAFNAPTVLLLVQWWLDHRYRTGAEVSQALPLIAAGFQFYGDLLPFD